MFCGQSMHQLWLVEHTLKTDECPVGVQLTVAEGNSRTGPFARRKYADGSPKLLLAVINLTP